MLENKIQFKAVISAVLNKINFYYLHSAILSEILKLLQMPETNDPNTILQQVHIGIIKLYEKHKQKVHNHLLNQKFNAISKQTKQLLYNIFIQIHSILISKPQNILHSAPISPFNVDTFYSHSLAPGMDTNDSFSYTEQMKKNVDLLKMYPYNLMNAQINSSFAPNINPNLNPSINSQFGFHAINPYLSYPTGTNTMNLPYGQMKGLNRNFSPIGIPFGINPYSNSTGIPSFYQHPYLNQYHQGMMGGYNQSPPPSFTHMMGLQKNQMNSKNPQKLGSLLNNQFEKKTALYHKKPQLILKNEKQKISQKEFSLASNTFKTKSHTNSIRFDQIKNKQHSKNEFPQKKLHNKDLKKLQLQNPVFRYCACKGYSQHNLSFTCPNCENKFHHLCLGLSEKLEEYEQSEISCAYCKMRKIDPLNKVQQIIGEFYLVDLCQNNFQNIINFKPYEKKCRDKNSKYEIQIRCIRVGQHLKNLQITWPDECYIKINGQKIIDIPALQSNSSLKKRKDYSVFITQNIYPKVNFHNVDTINSLQKTKITLQLKYITAEQAALKRIKNTFTFALGIYLIEKLNADQFYAKVMSEEITQDKNFLKNLMKTTVNQVQIDKITIRLFDPFSWDLIKTPVRGHKCNHAQCFDLKTFISMMFTAKNRIWKCPVCNKDARKFMLDNEQMELIKKAEQLQPIPKQVSIYKEGKVAFKIQKESDNEDEGTTKVSKTKKITKQKKEELRKQQRENKQQSL